MIGVWLGDPAVAIILTGLLVGLAAALIGPFLILRQTAMLSDAISHSIVFGIVMVWLLTGAVSGPFQIIGAALTGILTVVLTELLAASRRVKDDAAIGLVFPALFSIGVLLLNLYASDVHIDAHTVLLGEIGFVWLDTVSLLGVEVPRAIIWMGLMAAVNLTFVTLFWKELKLATFDPDLAHALGLMPRVLYYGLLALLSSTAVAAFDAVGAILFVAFVIVPPATAYLLTDRLGHMVLIASAVAIVSTVAGYFAAVALNVSIGGMMALMTGACLGLAWIASPRQGLIAAALRFRQNRLQNETRALVVHLATHETGEERRQENVTAALNQHLGWSGPKASAVLTRSRDRGYVVSDGEALILTERGRNQAAALLRPWQRP